MEYDNKVQMIELFLSCDKLPNKFDEKDRRRVECNVENIRKHLIRVAYTLTEIFKKADEEDKANLITVYAQSYPLICDYFNWWLSNPSREDVDNFLRGILMVYAWMPRILRIHTENESFRGNAKVLKTIDFLRDLKKYPEYDRRGKDSVYSFLGENQDKVNDLKNIVDNSLTATAKILHFVRLDDFPIWDSCIASKFGKTNTIKNYFDFLKSFEDFRLKYKNEIDDVLSNNSIDCIKGVGAARLVELSIYLPEVNISRE